jgi:glutamine amidotransferase
MVTIVDYGIGNLGSIQNMLKRIGVESKITSDINEISEAEKLILPGVGAFDNGVSKLNEYGLVDVLNRKALEDKIPVLGICLGMQLMTEKSEEGKLNGLGWIKGKTVRFKFEGENSKLKIPHMGWNTINIKGESPILRNLYPDSRFYFVHSFHVELDSEPDSLCLTNYGYDFVSFFQFANIIGVQFHPEKSHKYGMKLLKNFITI